MVCSETPVSSQMMLTCTCATGANPSLSSRPLGAIRDGSSVLLATRAFNGLDIELHRSFLIVSILASRYFRRSGKGEIVS